MTKYKEDYNQIFRTWTDDVHMNENLSARFTLE